jgi:hypothetical protein
MTRPEFSDLVKDRNPYTADKHRREVLWQIYVPLGLLFLVMLVGCVAATTGAVGSGSVSDLADASLFGLLIIFMAMSLIPLVILVGLAYGIFQLNKYVPAWLLRVQQVFQRVASVSHDTSNRATEPVIKINGLLAGLKSAHSTLSAPINDPHAEIDD